MLEVPAGLETLLQSRRGIELVTIVGIEWTPGSVSYYGSKTLPSIPSKVLGISEISSVFTQKSMRNRTATVTLDDSDGEIKGVLNTTNIHLQNAYVYLGTSFDEKVLLFKGRISTPFSWGETDKQLEFEIDTQVESFEVGFSPEEGQLDFVNFSGVGVPWPLCFGDVLHVPASKASDRRQAYTLDKLSYPDFTLPGKMDYLKELFNAYNFYVEHFRKVIQTVDAQTPSAGALLQIYPQQINQKEIDKLARGDREFQLKRITKDFNAGKSSANALAVARRLYREVAVVYNTNFLARQNVEAQIDGCVFKQRLKRDAAEKAIEFAQKAQDVYKALFEMQTTYCNQLLNKRTKVNVTGWEEFPLNEPVDVLIGNVKFRVEFDGAGSMDILAGPIFNHQNITVLPWTPDDEPCSDAEQFNGLNMFRIAEDIDLTGMWVVLRSTYSTHHMVQVEQQIGNKIYFKLVELQEASKDVSQTLDEAVGKITETDFVTGPFGQPIPSEWFTGNFDPEAWARKESQRYLQVVAQLNVEPTPDEKRRLAQLAYLEPYDNVSPDLFIFIPGPRSIYTLIGEDVAHLEQASTVILEQWGNDYSFSPAEVPSDLSWQAEVGSGVLLDGEECTVYIANIVPSTIRSVSAFRQTATGQRILAPVPESYYTKLEAKNLGTLTVTALTFNRPLSTRKGEGWEDDVYVSLTSSIGSNPVEVLEHLITTYTDGSVDSVSFDALKTQLGSNYPCNFALLSRPNAIQEIARVAWESRIGIWQGNDSLFKVKYLSEEPDTDITLEPSDVEKATLRVDYTSTDSLTTEIISTFVEDYLPLQTGERLEQVVYRHNVNIYNHHRSEEFFHAVTDRQLVEKTSSFWLIRNSNTWKRVGVDVPLEYLAIEPLDTIVLDFARDYYADGPIKCYVEETSIDIENNVVRLILNTGVKVGEMEQYPYFWPSSIEATVEWPTVAEIESGFAGGYGPGTGVEGNIDCSDGEIIYVP